MLSLGMLKNALFLQPGFALAFLLRPLPDERDLAMRIALYWGLSALIAFAFRNPAFVFLCLIPMVLALVPRRPAAAAIILPAFVIALPASIGWRVPFPGINFLIYVDHYRLLAILLFIPAALRLLGGKGARRGSDLADGLVFVYFLLTVLLHLRDAGSMTNGARIAVNLALHLPLLYFVITRSLVTFEQMRQAVVALMMTAIALTAAGLVGIVQSWNHYTTLKTNYGLGGASAFRDGGFRISGPLTSGEVGSWAGIGAGLSLVSRGTIGAVGWRCLFWAGATLPFVLAARSRGSLLGLVVFGLAVLVFRIKAPVMRVAYIGTGLIGAFVGYRLLSAGGFESVDRYGTFEYRERLLAAAGEQFSRKPLFGTPDYAQSPVFDTLIQGQGIVDFVNGYVQIALAYGGVGLALFLAIIALSWFGLLKAHDSATGDSEEARLRRRYAMVLGGAIPSVAVTMFTTSLISYILTTLFILVAMARAFARLPAVETSSEAERESAAPEAGVQEAAAREAAGRDAPGPVPAPAAARQEDPAEDERLQEWPEGYVPGKTGWPS